MADFTTADLEGANELLNKTLTDALALKDQLVASHGDDATALLNSLQSKVADLESSLLNMIPELPTVPNVNMQGEFAGIWRSKTLWLFRLWRSFLRNFS